MATEDWRWPDVPKNEWGPPAWRWLHRATVAYPRQPTRADVRLMWLRLWNFVASLPCLECRSHATTYFVRNPPDLTNWASLVRWGWRFHNCNNARLGKPLVSFEEFQKLYSKEFALAAAA